MVRSMCAISFLVGTVGLGFADDKDPVKEKLTVAKAAYEADLKKYRKDVEEWFNKREEVARKDGNKKQVDQIKAERATFDKSGELPTTIPLAIRQKPGLAKKTLEAAYAQAVKEYTMIKKDTEAAAVEAEGETFMKSPVGSPVPGGMPIPGIVPAKLGPYDGRTGATKVKLIQDGGGSDDSERAVALGLAWLAKQQKKDGGWVFDLGSKEHTAAATSLALLPFLAAGETHTDVKAKYRDVVKNGLDWLVKNCPVAGPNAGRISANMYEQAIATIPLCEAYGMTNDPKLKPVAQAAVNYIQKAQGPNGSWGYGPGGNGDTSIVGWQLQALHAAKMSGLLVDERVIKKASKFLDLAAAGAKKSMYGYGDSAGAAPGTSLTAVGLLSRSRIDAWGPDNPGMIDGVAGLVKHPPARARSTTCITTTMPRRSFAGLVARTGRTGTRDRSRRGFARAVCATGS